MSEWISVKDRLPQKEEAVLMAFWCEENGHGNMAVGFCREEYGHIGWFSFTDESFYTDCDATPTHWMPLPEPPGGEG